MKIETLGWGDSAIATAYVYSRVHAALDCQTDEARCKLLSDFMRQLAEGFTADTGEKIAQYADI